MRSLEAVSPSSWVSIGILALSVRIPGTYFDGAFQGSVARWQLFQGSIYDTPSCLALLK